MRVRKAEILVFTVPVTALDDKMEVIADTLAMGAPHEIDYTLTIL